MKGIGNDLVREARKRVGLTQAELAERVGTTQSAIARIENARTAPSFDSVLELVRACGLDLDLMLVERDDHDWTLAAPLLRMDPRERLEHHRQVTTWLTEVREAGERARAGA